MFGLVYLDLSWYKYLWDCFREVTKIVYDIFSLFS
jgi:hypothetical protein